MQWASPKSPPIHYQWWIVLGVILAAVAALLVYLLGQPPIYVFF
jgi:uncharacterized protein involved in exopolysaccharide biosynthesis